MSYIVDRIVGKFAVIEGENGEMTGVELARLPRDVKEGDVLLHELGQWRIDKEQTEARRDKARAKLHALWED